MDAYAVHIFLFIDNCNAYYRKYTQTEVREKDSDRRGKEKKIRVYDEHDNDGDIIMQAWSVCTHSGYCSSGAYLMINFICCAYRQNVGTIGH